MNKNIILSVLLFTTATQTFAAEEEQTFLQAAWDAFEKVAFAIHQGDPDEDGLEDVEEEQSSAVCNACHRAAWYVATQTCQGDDSEDLFSDEEEWETCFFGCCDRSKR